MSRVSVVFIRYQLRQYRPDWRWYCHTNNRLPTSDSRNGQIIHPSTAAQRHGERMAAEA